MNVRLLFLLALISSPLVGCGTGGGGPAEAPAGNELEQFLADNPEIDAETADDTADGDLE
ncbi:MAG: hypothetical protein AAGJ40_06190 [Planctomycetota bacterium]